MGKRLPRCISCNKSLTVWGKTPYGKKRYGCHTCKKTRVYKRQIKKVDFYLLFRQYVLWGHTYEQLSDQSEYSIQYLSRRFHVYLLQDPPTLSIIDQSTVQETFLLIDGLWLKRGFVLMAYRQSGNLTILHISVVGHEVGTKIAKDLRILKQWYIFTGVVSDGGTGIVKAVNIVFPHIPHQICLSHLHRDVINAIGRYPKDERVKELKRLADWIWLIESKEALGWWHKEVLLWERNYHSFLIGKRYDLDYHWWFIYRGIRRAIAILTDLPKTSFVFLGHPTMPKTTNELEASFGHLAKRWLAHRGLKTEKMGTIYKMVRLFLQPGKTIL